MGKTDDERTRRKSLDPVVMKRHLHVGGMGLFPRGPESRRRTQLSLGWISFHAVVKMGEAHLWRAKFRNVDSGRGKATAGRCRGDCRLSTVHMVFREEALFRRVS